MRRHFLAFILLVVSATGARANILVPPGYTGVGFESVVGDFSGGIGPSGAFGTDIGLISENLGIVGQLGTGVLDFELEPDATDYFRFVTTEAFTVNLLASPSPLWQTGLPVDFGISASLFFEGAFTPFATGEDDLSDVFSLDLLGTVGPGAYVMGLHELGAARYVYTLEFVFAEDQIPVPGTFWLMGAGLSGFWLFRRYRRNRADR
jgi:hypothetical protein